MRLTAILFCLVMTGGLLSCSHPSEELKQDSTVGYLDHLKASDVCQSVRTHKVQIRPDEAERAVIDMWIQDLEFFENTLNKVSGQKAALIQTFLWARERNLVAFPSAFYLKDPKAQYNDTQKRVALFKSLSDPLTPPSLLKHILQRELRTFSLKDGSGIVTPVLESYVRSFILKSRPANDDFIKWLTTSCS